MPANAAIYTLINALPEVTGGVYPGYAPRSAALPYVVYHRTDERQCRYMNGSKGLSEADYQINVHATNIDSAATVSEAIREGLDGLQHTTSGGINVRRISLTNQRDMSTLFDSSQDETVETQMDFTVYYFQSETP